MAEKEVEKVESEGNSKLQSRKFVVWLVWYIIAIVNLVIDAIVIIITKNVTAEMVSLTEKVLGWFFAISMMYLGMNVSQKVGFALSDALSAKCEKEKVCDDK